jgi:hypothetical protein
VFDVVRTSPLSHVAQEFILPLQVAQFVFHGSQLSPTSTVEPVGHVPLHVLVVLSNNNEGLHFVQISIFSEHHSQFVEQLVHTLSTLTYMLSSHLSLHSVPCKYTKVLVFPLASNCAQLLQAVEESQFSQGKTQLSHLKVVVFPYVPSGQVLVQVFPVKYG